MARGDEQEAGVKPSDLSEAQREALKRQYRGVFWDRKTKRWRCQLGYQSKKIFLGYFDDAGEAARAYDQKLVELRGAGARTNFPITEYLDMMPTPTKRGGGAGAGAVAAAAAAAAARDQGQHNMDEDDPEEEDEGDEMDQPGPSGGHAGGAAAAPYGAATPSLDPVNPSSGLGAGRLGGLLDIAPGSPRHGLSNLPAIAPLSTELPSEHQHAAAALAAQDYDMAGEDELTAAAQLAIEIRRSFDGSNFKWQQHHHQHAQQLPTATSAGSAGGSAAAAAAAGYGGRSGEFDLHTRPQQQQQMGTYGDDTAAAAAAGYGGSASLYGSYGHQQQQQQQQYGQQHAPVRNGSTPGELYGSSHGWADQAAAAAAVRGGYDGQPGGYSSHGHGHFSHHGGQQHHHHHHSHSGHGFSDSGGYAAAAQAHGGYPVHHQQQHHSQHHAGAAAAAAAGYSHHAHHAHYQHQHARHYQHHQAYQHHQQQQQAGGPGYYGAAEGDEQHMHGQQQQQPYHGHHPHQQQQQHGQHYPLHHSHSYPGAVGHEGGMEGAASAGYYHAGSTPGVYASHAEAVAAAAARASHAHSNGHYHSALHHHHHHHHQQQQYGGPDSRAGGELTAAQGMYGSNGDLQHYGGGLAAASQQHQQQYDARAAASNPAVAAADYRQRLAAYGLHSYSSEGGEYGAGAMEGEAHRGYAAGGQGMQHYQQQQEHMQQDGGATAMDAAGGTDCYNTRQAAYDTEDPWIQTRGFGRGSAAGSDAGLEVGAAGGAGLPAVKTGRGSGRASRAASRAAAVADSDDYDIDDDEDYGSDSDTGRGRGRSSRRRSRAAAAAGGAQNGGEGGVLRTKQRTDAGEEERGHSYRGVFWDKKSRRWRCQLGHKNKKIFLGYFGVAEDAARAYDQKLVELHGGSAKTNFPIHNYLGGSTGGKDTSAAAAAASPKAPEAADAPARRRSSHAGDASAKGSHAQHSELSWGALGLPRSARLSQDASEGAPRLSWAGVDTLSSWDQQDPDSQYSKRRKLMEGGGQLPTSPQDFGALAGGSHQAVGGEEALPPSTMARQSSGYRVVETPSVLTASLTGRHSSSGQAGGSGQAGSFDAAAAAAGVLQGAQASGGRSSLALARMASGEVGAVQALSGLHALGGDRSHPGGPFAAAADGLQQQAMPSGAAAANAVLAAAGVSAAAAAVAAAQQQSQASRLFDEAVNQYGSRASAPGLPPGPCTASGAAGSGRMSDPNTGASSSTATPPSAITAGGLFGPGGSATSPQNAAQAALSRLNSSEVRAVQALSGIHNDVRPYQGRGRDGAAWGGFSQQHQQQQGYHPVAQQGAPSPASITETVAKELLCRAPVVSAVASSSIAAVAAAAAAAAAAKCSEGTTRNSADGSFSGLVGEMAAGLGDSRLRAATPTDALNPDRLSTPALSPLLASSMLLPPPPPLQLQLEVQDLGESLPGTASATAAAAAAAGIASKAAGTDAAAAARLLSHLEPGDAFAAEAGWGSALDDLLMPKKRPSCSGNSGLIGLLENIGQFKHEADAAAAAVVVPQQQQPTADAAAAPAPAAAAAAEQPQQQKQQEDVGAAAAPATAEPVAAAPAVKVEAEQQQATSAAPAASAAAAVVPRVPAVKAELPPVATLPAAPVSFMAPTAEPMAVQP